MGRRLVQRRAAEEDVAEQLAYIAAERPAVAHRYAIALEDAFELIRRMPEVGFRSFLPANFSISARIVGVSLTLLARRRAPAKAPASAAFCMARWLR